MHKSMPSSFKVLTTCVHCAASVAVWDKVMLEAYCWCPKQQMQQMLSSFPYAQAGLPDPNSTVLKSWDFSSCMLSSSVTNCYGAKQWGWEDISTTEAVTQAEQAWREGGSGMT
jgi:hypothetical protein